MTKPMCPAPIREIGTPALKPPKGSCDCHVHIIGPQAIYPCSPHNTVEMHDSTLDDFRKVQAALGLSRALIVASGLQQYDYQPVLHTLCIDPLRYRGVIIPSPDITDAELEILDNAGVVGARFYPGIADPDERMLARVREIGWSAHFPLANPAQAEAWHSWIEGYAGRFVIEHSGMPNPAEGIESMHFGRVLAYLDTDRCWIKLSHRFSKLDYPPFEDSLPFNCALVEQRPDRMLYGSDYPHPNYWGPMPTEEQILDLLLMWAPDETVRHRILVDNPEELFGFPPDGLEDVAQHGAVAERFTS
jgi:2-pyrone-4,6-dicarboxylate lactonase